MSFVADDLAVHDQFDLSRVAGREPDRRWTCRATTSFANATFAVTFTGPAASSFTSPKPGDTSVHLELQGVGVAVGDVRAALGDALAPRRVVDPVDLAELHVHAALADAAAGDAREVRLAATFSGKPQFMMWYQQFHSGVRCVSIALMKSHTPIAVVTQISWAPMPSISGMMRFGSFVDGSLRALAAVRPR